jgi:EmrB/QacA subfamily drug resistance transporter
MTSPVDLSRPAMTSAEPAPTARDRAPVGRGLRGRPSLTLVAVALGVMMVALDGTVVSVANPTIERSLHASLAGLQWVTNGYLLSLAVLLIPGGKLGDRFGRRAMFSIGIAGFALASAGCALSSSIGMLVVFRVVQGMAGALLMPNTLAILRATYPPAQLTRAVGIWGATSALAVASGPIVGGLLVQHVSWESIFLLNLPLGSIALGTTLTVVAESREPGERAPFDFPGLLTLTVGLFAIVWALIKAQSHPWLSAYVLGFGLAGIALLIAFAAIEARTRAPMLPLDIFRSRSVSAGTLLVIIGFLGLFGVLFFVTLYLQNVHHYSPVQTGVRELPLTATFIVSPIVGGVMTGRLGPRVPVVIGMTLLGVAFLGLTGLGVDSPYSALWPWFVCIGAALGLIVTSTTQAILGNVAVSRGGVAGGLQSTANQLGGVLGTSVLGSILVSAVGGVLAARLRAAGVPAQIARAIAAQKGIVGSGIAPVTRSMPPPLRDAIIGASDSAFLHGLHTAMVVGAGLAFAGALLGLLVRRGADVGHGGSVAL